MMCISSEGTDKQTNSLNAWLTARSINKQPMQDTYIIIAIPAFFVKLQRQEVQNIRILIQDGDDYSE